jgi:hypothetical protein
MSKRTHDIQSDDGYRQQGGSHALRNPKRAKRCVIAEKENIPPPVRVESFRPAPKRSSCASRNVRESLIKNRKQFRSRQILQPKTKIVSHTNSKVLQQHPPSDHILKANLYDDESWVGQQQALFTSILNEVFASQRRMSHSWNEGILDKIRTVAFQYYQGNTFQLLVHRIKSVSSLALVTDKRH